MLTRRGTILAAAFMAVLLLTLACGGSAEETTAPTAPAPAPAAAAVPAPASTSAPVSTQLQTVQTTGTEAVRYGGIINGAGEEPKYGGIPIFSHRGDIPTSDPLVSTSISLMNVASSVFGRGNLLRPSRADNYTIEPYLAESWQATEGGKVWTFKIRPNIKWHDGTPFTAQDFKFFIDLATNPPKGRRVAGIAGSTLRHLEKVEVLDPLTLRITHKIPLPNWHEDLGSSFNTAHPKHLMQPQIDKGNFRVQPSEVGWVSLGPFKFKKYDTGSLFQVRRFDQYFEKDEKGRQLPYLDGIDFVIIRDRTAMVSAFRAGRLDGTARGTGFHLIPEQEEAIKKSLGNDKVWFARVIYLPWGFMPNSTRPPFNDIRLRKALSLYTDRQDVIKKVFGGYAVLGGMWAPNAPHGNPDLAQWPGWNAATKAQDQAEAKRLIKEAGYGGLKVTFTCRDLYIDKCEWSEGQLRGLGLDPVLDIVDTNLWTEKRLAGQIQIDISTPGPLFPGNAVSSYITTNPNATLQHGDTHVDELLERIDATVDQTERIKLTREIERYIYLDKAYANMWLWEYAVIAYRSYLKGMPVPQQNVQNNGEYATTWMDR